MNEIPLNVTEIKGNINFVFETINKKPEKGYEDYVKDKLEKLGIEVRKSNEVNGHPDFICEYKEQRFYVEVKGYNDGIRANQLNWMIENNNKLIYIYYISLEKLGTITIQKQISRKIGDKEYEKYMIVVAPKIIKQLGWKQGDKLNPKIVEDKLVIKLQR